MNGETRAHPSGKTKAAKTKNVNPAPSSDARGSNKHRFKVRSPSMVYPD